MSDRPSVQIFGCGTLSQSHVAQSGGKAREFMQERASLPGFWRRPAKALRSLTQPRSPQSSPGAVTLLRPLLASPQSRLALVALSFQDLPVRAHLWGRSSLGAQETGGPSPLIFRFWVPLCNHEHLEIGEGTMNGVEGYGTAGVRS